MVRLCQIEASAEASAALAKSPAVEVAVPVASPNCDWVAAAACVWEASTTLRVKSPPTALAKAGEAAAIIKTSIVPIATNFRIFLLPSSVRIYA
jgi:hypothetical protein